MEAHRQHDYQRIAQAIHFIRNNFQQQPSLEEIAATVHLSPFHFQRLFTAWAGVSPKKFMQFISVEYAKKLLKENRATLLDTAMETGLSGTGRLHDLFVNVEGMTPGEYKNGGEKLEINYSFADSPFGNLIIASTHKGICHMAFVEDQDRALDELRSHFEKAGFKQHMDKIQQDALFIFQEDWSMPQRIRLHLKGTAFQLKVWDSLLKVPLGKLVTYGQLADTIGTSGASRAVGTAVGSNPVAFLIPCHRVIRSNGQSGEYRWGGTRKSAMIGWEAAKLTI